MNINEILTLFPTATIQNTRDKNNFSITYKNNWIVIPNISKREQTLLSALLNKNKFSITEKKGPWAQYLQASGNKPNFNGQIRFLFFKCDKATNNTKNWLDAINNMFSHPLLESFYIEKNTYCFIEKITSTSYNLKDFLGVLQTIEADTGVNSKLYVGHPWTNTDSIVRYFNEELYIFQQENDQNSSPVMSFSSIALPFFTKKALHKSNIIFYYRKKLKDDSQSLNIIRTLYKNEGNISLTAKQLYLHRNTLLYHIDKIYRTLGLDLRQMDDLLLAYLAVL